LLSVNRRKKVSKVAQVPLMTQKKSNPFYVHWRALFLKIKNGHHAYNTYEEKSGCVLSSSFIYLNSTSDKGQEIR